MSEFIQCPNCFGEVTPDSDFCPHCGLIFEEAGEVLCDTDPGQKAMGICIICRKVVCEKCGVGVNGRCFCLDHQHVEVRQDWAQIFESSEIAEAELVKSVMESTGHKVLVQNFNSIGFVWDGGGDSPISRSNINKPAKVFVPIPEYLDAVKELAEWQSSQSNVGPDSLKPEM